jgi:hypothetical protein
MLVSGKSHRVEWSEYMSDPDIRSALVNHGHLDRVYPANVREEDRHVFDSYLDCEFPGMVLPRLENVLADAEGWLYQGGCRLLESTAFYFQPQHDQLRRIEEIARREPMKWRIRRWVEQRILEPIYGPAL